VPGLALPVARLLFPLDRRRRAFEGDWSTHTSHTVATAFPFTPLQHLPHAHHASLLACLFPRFQRFRNGRPSANTQGHKSCTGQSSQCSQASRCATTTLAHKQSCLRPLRGPPCCGRLSHAHPPCMRVVHMDGGAAADTPTHTLRSPPLLHWPLRATGLLPDPPLLAEEQPGGRHGLPRLLLAPGKRAAPPAPPHRGFASPLAEAVGRAENFRAKGLQCVSLLACICLQHIFQRREVGARRRKRHRRGAAGRAAAPD
jgi:hypothetical protein